MTANIKGKAVSSSLDAADVGGIGVSISGFELSAFDISRDMVFFWLF